MFRFIRRGLVGLALLLCTLPTFAATVYVEEFGQYIPFYWQAAQTPGLVAQTVAIGGSSAQSSAFNARTVLIRVHTDAICSIEIGGTNPTATTSSMRFIAGQTEYFLVRPGDKLAVITNN